MEAERIAAEEEAAEMERIAAEKQAELEEAEAEAEAAADAAAQAANVAALLSNMTSSSRRARKRRSSENITKPETCAELINMTAEMNTAFSSNTFEGMTLGSAYAAALLEDPTPTCSDEELEAIRAVKAALEATQSSLNEFVTAAQEAVANATAAVAATLSSSIQPTLVDAKALGQPPS